MTIDKAIQILEAHHIASYSFHSSDFWDAIRLSVEALKALEYHRSCYPDYRNSLLPGETKD